MIVATFSLLTASIVAAPPTPAPLRARADHAVVAHCQVFLINDVEVPALETGPLLNVMVREGQFVKRDELLAQIDDKQAQLTKRSAEAEREAAQAKADDDIDVRYAMKSFELAEAELNQDLEIKRRSSGAVTDSEIRRKQLVRTREQLGIDRAKLDRQVAQLTSDVKKMAVDVADESILRRRIAAPFDGIVVDVMRQKSEWVNAGETVMRVVRMDRLQVDGFLSGDEFNPTDVAQRRVTVEIELAQGRRERFEGEVVFVNPLVQAGHKYRVRAEVDNRFERNEPLLRPGMTATMLIHLN
jgi:multidrug efflux pump subunit AcrA (membrane-fusion protein)